MVESRLTFTELAIPGAWLIDAASQADERGSFSRMFDSRSFEERGLQADFPQRSVSHNRRRFTLRGLHFQHAPHAETKLVRCTRGAIFDVVVDLRSALPTFGTWLGVDLRPERPQTLYVPPGCAHGFMTLEDDADVDYAITPDHNPAASDGVRWNCPRIGIVWPATPMHISDRDRSLPEVIEPDSSGPLR